LCALVAGATQSCARISLDNGLTWLPERYRPIFGFGYPGSLVLEDDAIVTITGASLGDNGDPRQAAAIRWRLSEALGGEFVGLQPVEGP